MSGKRECGVCWHVYDPAEGDDVWQVPPGTPFEALPDDWRCPQCDSPKEKYLPQVDDDEQPAKPAADALAASYRAAAERMKELPIFNPRLEVEAIGFTRFGKGELGVLLTPWFMNLVFVPADGEAVLGERMKQERALPSGLFEFIGARLDGVAFELCSLFSPVLEFEDQAAARATAVEALRLAMTPEQPAPPEPPVTASRRELFDRFRRSSRTGP